jgi:hypothetical protein
MNASGKVQNMPDSETTQENAALDFSAGIQKADRLGALLVSLPKWTAWAIIAWQVRLSIEALVGKNAVPSLLIRFWRQASIWEVGCWIASMLGLIFGLYSRHLVKRQVARDLSRIDSIEKRLDSLAAASGTSSGGDDRSAT